MAYGAGEVNVVVDQVLRTVLTVTLIALAGFGIYALWILVAALRSLRTLADDVDARLPGLIEDADVTMQAASLELMRLDDILTDISRVSDRVEETTRAAEEAVHVPMAKIAAYAETARRFISAMRER